MSDYLFAEKAESLMDDNGEIHCTVEEFGEEEIELRSGNTEFDFDAGVISVESPDGYTHFFGMNRLVHFYAPKEVFH